MANFLLVCVGRETYDDDDGRVSFGPGCDEQRKQRYGVTHGLPPIPPQRVCVHYYRHEHVYLCCEMRPRHRGRCSLVSCTGLTLAAAAPTIRTLLCLSQDNKKLGREGGKSAARPSGNPQVNDSITVAVRAMHDDVTGAAKTTIHHRKTVLIQQMSALGFSVAVKRRELLQNFCDSLQVASPLIK